MIAQIPKKSITNVDENYEYEGIENDVATKNTKISELEYLAEIVPQLHKMSAGLGESTLAYLFMMVIIEIRLQLDVEKYKTNTINF